MGSPLPETSSMGSADADMYQKIVLKQQTE